MQQSSEKNTVVYRHRALTLVTRCQTVDEFVTMYGGQLSEGMITMTARRSPGTGVRRRFRICLRDHTTVLSGDGVVADCEQSNDRVSLHFRLLAVDDEAAPMLRQLQGRRCARGSVPGELTPASRLALPLPAPDKTSITRNVLSFEDDDDFDDDDEPVTTVHRPEVVDKMVAAAIDGKTDAADEADEQAAVDEEAIVAKRPQRRSRWRRGLAAGILTTAVALNAGWLGVLPLNAPDTPAVRTATAKAAVTAPASLKIAMPTPTVRRLPPTPDEPTPRPAAAAPTVAADCIISISSAPRGAAVTYNGTALGKTPIVDAHVPCGKAELQLRRAAYQTVTRHVRVRKGHPLNFRRRLQRSYRRIKLASSPPGAVFLVNGRFVLANGNVAYVPSHSAVVIRASKRGYADWTRRIYIAGNRTVRARLHPK